MQSHVFKRFNTMTSRAYVKGGSSLKSAGYRGSVQALELADYRAAVARNYLTATDLADFRAQRDELFANHPQSPIPRRRVVRRSAVLPAERRVRRRGRPARGPGRASRSTPAARTASAATTGAGILDTPWGELSLWWLAAYGGGLFLPVRDATCGPETVRRRPLPDRHGEGHPRPRPGDAHHRPASASTSTTSTTPAARTTTSGSARWPHRRTASTCPSAPAN